MFALSIPPKQRSYHHGDLRQGWFVPHLKFCRRPASAGSRCGPQRGAPGCRQWPPYRHFADKEALLAAVAEYGFRELAARLTAATAMAADPRAGLAALGVAYVLFACDQPSLFKLMFGPTIEKKSGHPVLDEAGSACFNALRQAVKAAKFFEGDSDGNDVSLACWSLVHGVSALIVDGRLAEYDSDPAEAVAARLTRLLSDSLAALSEKNSGSTQSNQEAHAHRRRRSANPVNSFADV